MRTSSPRSTTMGPRHRLLVELTCPASTAGSGFRSSREWSAPSIKEMLPCAPGREVTTVCGCQGGPRTRSDAVRGDKAYVSRLIRGRVCPRGITTVISEPGDQNRHRRRDPQRLHRLDTSAGGTGLSEILDQVQLCPVRVDEEPGAFSRSSPRQRINQPASRYSCSKPNLP